MNKKNFLLSYIALFVVTYLVRYVVIFTGGTVGFSLGAGDFHESSYIGTAETMLLIIYALMIFVCFKRGQENGRGYLLAFPLVGGFFDVFLPLIVFVPTILNAFGLAFGIPDKASSSKKLAT